MQKVKVLTKGLTQQEIEAAMHLAVEAGFDQSVVEAKADIGAPDPECDDEIVLFVMAPALCTDPSLEAELKKTPNGGRRAICVWPEGTTAGEQPPATVSRYAYSIIPWSADKFRAVAADDDVMCFETPDGLAMPQVKMEHNCCVEEKVKPA
jgi:hypothetical protein